MDRPQNPRLPLCPRAVAWRGRLARQFALRRRQAHADAGISLVEVMVAFVVLCVTLVPLSYLLTSTVASASGARQREAALQLADSWIEILSNSTPPTGANGSIPTDTGWQVPTVPSGAIPPKSTFAGTPFTVFAQYSYQSVNQSGQSDLCLNEEPPSPSHPGVIELQVKVQWDQGNQSLIDTTNINYPKPGLQNQGFLAVQVTNAGGNDAHANSAAQRFQAINIHVTGPSTSLFLNPDENGCAFAQVLPGTYTVTLQQPSTGALPNYTGTPPFVDATGNASPPGATEMVNVTAETTDAVTFDEGIGTAISYGGASAIAGGVECPGTNTVACVTQGAGLSSAVASWGGNGSSWSSTALVGATTLNQVACTTSAVCVGVGNNVNAGSANGIILTTSTNLGSVSADLVPSGVTDIIDAACPSSNGCYALGTTGTGAVLLAGAVGQGGSGDYWTSIAPPSTTFTNLSSIACASSSTCVVGGSFSIGGGASAPGILRLDGDPAGLGSNQSWTPTFTLEGIPSTTTSVGQLSCPSSSDCEATAIGDSTSTTDPTILTASIGTAPDSWVNESNFPTGTASITGLSCNSQDCVAIGTTAVGSPAVWTGYIGTAGSHDWAQTVAGTNGFPTSLSAVTSVACGNPSGNDTADCVVAATPNSTSAPALLIEGSLNGSWTWNPTTAPTNSSVLYYTGIACEPSGSIGSACAAAGATAGGPVVVTSSGPSSSSWNVETPATLSSAAVAGIPLETTPSTLTSWTVQVTHAQAIASNATSLPNYLYPLANGYNIAAGDCAAEAPAAATYAKTSLSSAPGGTAGVTVPLGLLPLQVVSAAGTPAAGATVTLTATLCGAGGDTYTLPVTDGQGFTTTSVPYGTYTYAVSGGPATSASITVGPNSVTLSSGATAYLPEPLVVLS